jgi:hypothetical protein
MDLPPAASAEGLEPPASSSASLRSVQLSYADKNV